MFVFACEGIRDYSEQIAETLPKLDFAPENARGIVKYFYLDKTCKTLGIQALLRSPFFLWFYEKLSYINTEVKSCFVGFYFTKVWINFPMHEHNEVIFNATT